MTPGARRREIRRFISELDITIKALGDIRSQLADALPEPLSTPHSNHIANQLFLSASELSQVDTAQMALVLNDGYEVEEIELMFERLRSKWSE